MSTIVRGWPWFTVSTASSSGVGRSRAAPQAASALTSLGRQLPPKPQPGKRNELIRPARARRRAAGAAARASGARRASPRPRRRRRPWRTGWRSRSRTRSASPAARWSAYLIISAVRVARAQDRACRRSRGRGPRCTAWLRPSMPPITIRSGRMKSSTAAPSDRNSGFMPTPKSPPARLPEASRGSAAPRRRWCPARPCS